MAWEGLLSLCATKSTPATAAANQLLPTNARAFRNATESPAGAHTSAPSTGMRGGRGGGDCRIEPPSPPALRLVAVQSISNGGWRLIAQGTAGQGVTVISCHLTCSLSHSSLRVSCSRFGSSEQIISGGARLH